MSELVCIRGEIALVDPEDFDRCKSYRWRTVKIGRKTNKQKIYVAAKINGVNNFYLHRFVMDAKPGEIVDHIRGKETLDCRKSNLRIATRHENARNREPNSTGRNPSGIKTSQYKGVSWNKQSGLWKASIWYDGTCRVLGLFEKEDDAAKAYDQYARQRHHAFGWYNFPAHYQDK